MNKISVSKLNDDNMFKKLASSERYKQGIMDKFIFVLFADSFSLRSKVYEDFGEFIFDNPQSHEYYFDGSDKFDSKDFYSLKEDSLVLVDTQFVSDIVLLHSLVVANRTRKLNIVILTNKINYKIFENADAILVERDLIDEKFKINICDIYQNTQIID